MLFWATAVHYDFKEVMSLPAKIANVSWMQHALIFLDRIEALAPDGFGGGAVEFGKAISYLCLPLSQGGDLDKATIYMQKAVGKHPDWFLG